MDEARSRIIASVAAVPSETVGLADAWGRVTAAPVRARLAQPPADVSAMDGYALRAPDAIAGACLRVIGAAPAGHPFGGRVGPGEAVRLFTGGVVPDGADAILLQEDAERDGDRVRAREAVRAGRHIRRAGQDFAAGDTLLPCGRRLTARDIGLAAAANHPWLLVHRRPRVAILATGDEIALPGEPLPAGGIVSSNAHALAALIRAHGAVPMVLPIAADDLGVIGAAADQARGADLLVVTGGASVGDHDLVVPALAERGLRMDFWKVAMRPGKPLMHGHLGAMPVLGLPGNPVSALICAALFLVPALDRLSGGPGAPPTTASATLGAPVCGNDRRTDHLRATLSPGTRGIPVATPFPVQDSAMLHTLARADALIVRPANAPALKQGDPVEIISLATLGL